MNLDQFIQAVLDEAQKEGILAAEIYLSSRDSFRPSSTCSRAGL